MARQWGDVEVEAPVIKLHHSLAEVEALKTRRHTAQFRG